MERGAPSTSQTSLEELVHGNTPIVASSHNDATEYNSYAASHQFTDTNRNMDRNVAAQEVASSPPQTAGLDAAPVATITDDCVDDGLENAVDKIAAIDQTIAPPSVPTDDHIESDEVILTLQGSDQLDRDCENGDAKESRGIATGEIPQTIVQCETHAIGIVHDKEFPVQQQGDMIMPSSQRTAPHPGAFPISGIRGDDDIIDLDSNVWRFMDLYSAEPDSNLQTNTNVSAEPPMATPITAEMAPNAEDMQARIRETVEQQLAIRVAEELRIQSEAISRHNSVVTVQAVQVDEDGTGRGVNNNTNDDVSDSSDKENNTENQSSRWYTRGFYILIAFVVLGVGLGIGTAIGTSKSNDDEDQNEQQQPTSISDTAMRIQTQLPTAIEVQTTMSPTTFVPSQTPSINQSDEFFALLDILQPILAESPTFHSRTHLQNQSTVEYQVLDWMANDDDGLSDDLQIKVANSYRLLERYVLGIAYHRWNGDLWSKQHNFLTNAPVCDWNDGSADFWARGIGCSSQGLVNVIAFQRNSIRGPFFSELFHLTMLEELYVDSNTITGTIPTEIGYLSRLISFNFDIAEVVGTIPTEIGMLSNLEECYASDNSITGTIPTEVGYLTAIKYLAIHTNELSGTMPSEIGNMTSLAYFWAYGNDFDGTIPTDFQQLTVLEYFEIENNRITGDLNPVFCDTLMFESITSFWSDCLASEDGTPARVNCTCCTTCCDVDDTCLVN